MSEFALDRMSWSVKADIGEGSEYQASTSDTDTEANMDSILRDEPEISSDHFHYTAHAHVTQELRVQVMDAETVFGPQESQNNPYSSLLDQVESGHSACSLLQNMGSWTWADTPHTPSEEIHMRDGNDSPGAGPSPSPSTRPVVENRRAEDETKDDGTHKRTERCVQFDCHAGSGCDLVNEKDTEADTNRKCASCSERNCNNKAASS